MRRLQPFLLALAIPVACSQDEPRYDVHRYVQTIVADLGSGLALGAPLGENATRASRLQWVQHVGLVGAADDKGLFAQIRLYPDLADRAQPTVDSSARVRAIELVSATGGNIETIQFGLMRTFGGIPKRGCLVPEDPDGELRDVQYWTAPGDAGGVAILQDWGDGSGNPRPETRQTLWSVFAWSGPFNATETLLAPFEPRQCDGTNSAITMKSMQATVAAVEGVERAFKDSIHASRQAVVNLAERERTNADVPDACSTPGPEGLTTWHRFPGFSIELPSEFTVHDLERTNRRALYWGTAVYLFNASDGDRIEIRPGREGILPHTVGGMVVAHCDKTLSARRTHIELMHGGESGGKPRLLVQAHLLPPHPISFEAEVSSQTRQRALLRAINTLELTPQWGKASPDALARPNRNPPPE